MNLHKFVMRIKMSLYDMVIFLPAMMMGQLSSYFFSENMPTVLASNDCKWHNNWELDLEVIL